MAHNNAFYFSGNCNINFGDNVARERLCYNCKEAGHLSRQCTKPRRAEGSSGGRVRGGGQGRSGGRGIGRRRSGGRGSDRGRGGDMGRNPRTSRPRSPSRHRSPQRRPSRSRGRSGRSVATDQPNASPVRGGVPMDTTETTREEVIVEQPPANTD